jgi:uncharacterized protein YqeY
MSIREELRAELTDAMVARDKPRTAVIRQVESEIALARSAPDFTGEVDDALYAKTLAAYVKKMDKARKEFLSAGERGADQAAKLAYEIDYLSRWLPEGIGEEATRQLVERAIADLGLGDEPDPKVAGRVVGHIMKTGPEGLDGGLVNRLVREGLATPDGGGEAGA